MTTNRDAAVNLDRVHKAQRRFVLPDDAREVILVRHGSAGGGGVPAGHVRLGNLTLYDPELWPDGHRQAEAVAQRLQSEPITHIFVTPQQRTHQTAAPLAAVTGIAPAVVPELHEVHMGDWELDFYARAAAEDEVLKRMFIEERWDVIPNAELMETVAARVRIGIRKIVDSLELGKTGVVFSHAATIAEVCRQATGSRPLAFTGVENGSISRLVIHHDDRWTLRSFNDVAHLAEA